MKRVFLCLAIPLSATAPLIPEAVHDEIEVDSLEVEGERKRSHQGKGYQSNVSKLPSSQIVCWRMLTSIDNTLMRTDTATTQNNLDAIAQVEQAISKLGLRNKFIQDYRNFWDAELKTLQHKHLGWNRVNDFIRDVRTEFFNLTTSRMHGVMAPPGTGIGEMEPQCELQLFHKTLDNSSSFSGMVLAMHKAALAMAIHSESLYQEQHAVLLLKDIDRVGRAL